MTVDLEEELSVVIGKNNCGKTSLLLILDKFIGKDSFKNTFSFDDFSVEFKDLLKSKIANPAFAFLDPKGILLKLFIEYDENDNLSNIGNKLIMDLDPENKMVVLSFSYFIPDSKIEALRTDFNTYFQKRKDEGKKEKDLFFFLKDHHKDYFEISKKTLQYDWENKKENDAIFTDLKKDSISLDKIINFKWISAKRNVSNKDVDKALSVQASRIYKQLEANNSDPELIEKFKETLSETDDELTEEIYKPLYQETIEDIKKFGGIKDGDSHIKVTSSLQHRELLEGNTTVMYNMGNAGNHILPEHYNGLGYMNLISMIFEIKILIHELRKLHDEKPADINLLFIEEPEAHTHPQMQRTFIKNIKSLLKKGIVRDDGENRSLQTILTTHSSHIVSESEFDDIKYFQRTGDIVISKNIKELEVEYEGQHDCYKFLKQYLTIHRSELFFADKAIFIEGDTERLLLPSMMKKLDQENKKKELKLNGMEVTLPLLSQNISVVEVGAYAQVFEKFINFIGIKSLIITDIDSTHSVVQKNEEGTPLKNTDGSDKVKYEACAVANGEKTSNGSLKFFYRNKKRLDEFTSLVLNDRTLSKNLETGEWEYDEEGSLVCAYQVKEKNKAGTEYHARSFEDAFFHMNIDFIKSKVTDENGDFIKEHPLKSLTDKYLKKLIENNDAYFMAEHGVGSKPSFAMEILLNSETKDVVCNVKNSESIVETFEFSDWNTPSYIKEGLEWLRNE